MSLVAANPFRQDWWKYAHCAGTDPDLFWPKGVVGRQRRDDKSPRMTAENQQKQSVALYCKSGSGCPVQQQCLQYALDNNEKSGVWGGTTEFERQVMIRNVALV